ncbi:MAG: Imm51 family immunity protein [Aminipila sp.]
MKNFSENALVNKYLTGLIQKMQSKGYEETDNGVYEITEYAHGASQTDIDKLLKEYPNTSQTLIDLLKTIDGTYFREYEKGKVLTCILSAELSEYNYYDYYLLSAKQMLDTKNEAMEYYGEEIDNREYAEIDNRITNSSKQMNWLHFADCSNNGGTSQLFIDFSPSEKGLVGQIVMYLHDPDEFTVIANSFEEYLELIIESDFAFVDILDCIYEEKSEDMERKQLIKTLEELPLSELSYDNILILGRAYNNDCQPAKAKEVMLTVQALGENDPIWNYRMGYSCYFLTQYDEAITYLENAKAMGLVEWANELLPDCKSALTYQTNHENELPPEKSDMPTYEYVFINKHGTSVSVYFDVGSDVPFSIGEKMQDICDNAYMNGYNWEAFFDYYLSQYEPDILVGMDSDPEAGSYIAYYTLTAENEKRAEKFVNLIKHLLENEEKIYDELRLNKDKINWD